MELKQLLTVANQIAKERGLDAGRVIEIVEDSIATAYRKEYGHRGELIKAELNRENGELKFWQEKEAVDETMVRREDEEIPGETGIPSETGVEERGEIEEIKLPHYNPERHIWLDEAREIKPDAALGEKLRFPLKAEADFGRIAAQSAKQVILQKFREAEREAVLKEFKNKEGEIVSGVIHRFDRGNVFVDLGRTTGVMFESESVPGEHYRVSERRRFYLLAVQEDYRGHPGIILSRSHPKFVTKLFEMEVPEIAEGVVEIKEISREPGNRTKIAVAATISSVDPVGSCVGQRGTRVMTVTNELGQEKIDIIEWSDNLEKFIASSMSPAKVRSVEILPRREARVIVPEDQLSLAIGKGGQNVRLAAKLTGMKIDVRSEIRPEEVQEGGVAAAEEAIEETAEQDKIEENKLIPKYRDDED
jgi:N utilization substance protein A